MQAAQVIPFRFEARQVRTLLIDDQPWFVAADVCQALAVRNNRDALSRLDDDEKGVATTDTLGGLQEVGVINESGLYSLILTSRKAEAKRFKKWVTAEVLPAIRKHGRYHDMSGQMGTLIGHTIGTTGFNCLSAIVDGKVRHLPAVARRGAKNHLWSQVHKAFSVVTAEDIPASQLDSARNFIAAYVIHEGEWLPRQEDASGSARLAINFPAKCLAELNPNVMGNPSRTLAMKEPMLVVPLRALCGMDSSSPTLQLLSLLRAKGYEVEGCRAEINAMRHYLEEYLHHCLDMGRMWEGRADRSVCLKVQSQALPLAAEVRSRN